VAKNAADIVTFAPPTDWLNYADAKYTDPIKASAARRAYGPGQIVSLTGFADTAAEDAAYIARFTADYVVSNAVHPSAASYLRAAFYEAADTRPANGVLSGTTTPEPVLDIKPNWPYAGGDGTLGGAVGMGPIDGAVGNPKPVQGLALVISATTGAAAGFTCTVTGEEFPTGCVAYFDGVAKTTTRVSATSVTFPTGATTAGQHTVRVDNSNTVAITVTA
jgi:IPT/TIG domain